MLVSFVSGHTPGEFLVIWGKKYLSFFASSSKGETFRSRCAYEGSRELAMLSGTNNSEPGSLSLPPTLVLGENKLFLA